MPDSGTDTRAAAPEIRAASPAADQPFAGPRARRFGMVNVLGVWTLYMKEVRRFVKVWTQTMLAPVMTSLLFLAVFTLALGRTMEVVPGISFAQFLAPGLVMMAMVQQAFANTSSSLVISKVQGNIVDVLMPPLSPGELTLGYVGGGATRGVLVGVLGAAALAIFVPTSIHSIGHVLFHGVMASVMLSLLGVVGGIWSEKFDHIAFFTNFVITPLAFLSGTFYSITRLPEVWQTAAHFNPFFYMIDGFRYGFIGHADGSLELGYAVMLGANALLIWLAHWMFRTGYKLRP